MSEKLCELKKNGSSGGTVDPLYLGAFRSLSLPKDLLDKYKYIRALTAIPEIGFTSGLTVPVPYGVDSQTPINSLGSNKVLISSLNVTAYLFFAFSYNYWLGIELTN